MVEGDPVEWTFYGDIDWMGGDIVDNVISDYSREKGGTVYEYGYVPTNLIIEKITPIIIDLGYDTFDEWHKAYQSTNPANHGDSQFPIIVSDNCDEYIEDGWHRFNYYLTKYDTTPVIKC